MWSIFIESIPKKRIRFIKITRREFGANLKQAADTYEDMVGNLPYELISELDRDDADRIAKAIRTSGTTVTVKQSTWLVTTTSKGNSLVKPHETFAKDGFFKRYQRAHDEGLRRIRDPAFWLPLLFALLIVLSIVFLPNLWTYQTGRPIGMFVAGLLVLFSAFSWVSFGVPRVKTWTCANCGHDLRGEEEPHKRCPECGSERQLPPGAAAFPDHVQRNVNAPALFVIFVAGLWTIILGYLLFG